MEGHVYHSRSETAQNSFRYPIFNVFVSIGAIDQLKSLFKKRFLGMLSIEAKDYLNKPLLFSEIENFVDKNFSVKKGETYNDVVLQSMPRMFGYVFNPVSFWYFLKDDSLAAVLCEVNNTFGEKHYYWLNQNQDLNKQWISADKEFHVSPFFDLHGQYKFKFILNANSVEAHIQYITFEQKNRLITWVKGELKPVSELSLGKILMKYGWMTPLVVFRIHYQALKLFSKKVKFFPKPSPPTKEVTNGKSLVSR
jgi:DUF1365 family protein